VLHSMPWMIYGANGYTGRLIAAEALRRGLQPVLAGRNETAVTRLAGELGLEHAVFDLTDPGRIRDSLAGMRLVLHCAGPFSATSRPMLDACLAVGCHYLDITGEIAVFEAAWRRSEEARKADVVMCPGAGFDVAPTDCLAASLVTALPATTHLVLAFEAGGGPSPGTAKTGIEGLASGGRIRRDGELVKVPLAWRIREIPFAHAHRLAVTIPWGDVFTAWVSTGVPNIEVYYAAPPAVIRQLKLMRWLRPLLGLGFVQETMKRRAGEAPGPDPERRAGTRTEVWGQAISADGRARVGTVSGPNGYDFTVLSSLAMAEHLLANDAEGGYYTPSLLMGADFAATLPGVTMQLGG
jgi:short subunit dehydrogenase-like uncharacterized protein